MFSRNSTLRMTVHILLVDDDDVVHESIRRYVRKNGVNYSFSFAEDGAVALNMLKDMQQNHKLHQPILVLLDLNMPIMNGFEFLEAIRSDEHLKSMVVFVLTTSNSEEDKIRAYKENIAGFLVKDKVGPQFSKLFSLLEQYTSTVSFPESSFC